MPILYECNEIEMPILYECNECERKCKSTNQFQCSESESIWKESALFKITEVPEPITELCIKYPVQMHNITAAYMLKDWNRKRITINGVSTNGFEKRCNQSTVWFPSRWIKIVPQKPTAEELHLVIYKLLAHVEHTTGRPLSPEIIAIAKSEK